MAYNRNERESRRREGRRDPSRGRHSRRQQPARRPPSDPYLQYYPTEGGQPGDFGEEFGNDYGYGREGEHVEPLEYYGTTEEASFADRYSRPTYTELDASQGPYRGMGPSNYRRSDERILEEICQRLTDHGQIDARTIEVRVQEAEVILEGQVDDRRTKRLAEAVAESVPGVNDVHNRLRLRKAG